MVGKQQFPVKSIDIVSGRLESGNNDGLCISGIGTDDSLPPNQWLVSARCPRISRLKRRK